MAVVKGQTTIVVFGWIRLLIEPILVPLTSIWGQPRYHRLRAILLWDAGPEIEHFSGTRCPCG